MLEVLIVLVIISIVTTIAVLSLHLLDGGRNVAEVADEFVQSFKLAEQEALLRPAVLGLRFTKNGYDFYQFDSRGKKNPWKTLSPDRLSRPTAFDRGIRAEFNKKSMIVISPSGDVTPFILRIMANKREKGYEVSVKQNGAVMLREVRSRG